MVFAGVYVAHIQHGVIEVFLKEFCFSAALKRSVTWQLFGHGEN